MLIIIYVTVNMYCVQSFGNTSKAGFIINTVFSVFLVALMSALKRLKHYGLTKIRNAKKCLYFAPLILIVSVNLWSGINISNTSEEILFHILTMLNIGFIEEIIFRGFLYKMMVKNKVGFAAVISSLTFGIGHIVNLLNGAEVLPTLMQIFSAVSIGYLFVIIFEKSKSLVPCIVAHSLINSLSVFYVETPLLLYISSAFLTVIPLAYAFYINKSVRLESD